MPKLKTHKGAQSRFDITGTGKVMRAKVGKSHLRAHKSKQVKRLYEHKLLLSPANAKAVKRLLPYGIG